MNGKFLSLARSYWDREDYEVANLANALGVHHRRSYTIITQLGVPPPINKCSRTSAENGCWWH